MDKLLAANPYSTAAVFGGKPARGLGNRSGYNHISLDDYTPFDVDMTTPLRSAGVLVGVQSGQKLGQVGKKATRQAVLVEGGDLCV